MIKFALFGFIAMVAASGASAGVNDAAGDFLASYAGPQNGDLDILSANAVFDGTNFTLSSVQNGAIGSSAGSLFVWGINRGGGTERLTLGTPSVGAGVFFDAVAVLFPDGTGRVAAFPAMGPPVITPLIGAVTITGGNTIIGVIPLSLLPSRGFAPAAYTFNLWSRRRADPLVDGTNIEIADFAPDATSFAAVPEPATWALMLTGFGLIGATMRRPRRAFG